MIKYFCNSSRQKQACAHVMQCHRRWPYFALISLAALALSACSSTPSAFATPSARHDLPLNTVDSGVGKALRVIVKFRQTVPYRDAAFLQDIAHHIRAHHLHHQRVARYPCVSDRTPARPKPCRHPSEPGKHPLRAARRGRRFGSAVLKLATAVFENPAMHWHAWVCPHRHPLFQTITMDQKK